MPVTAWQQGAGTSRRRDEHGGEDVQRLSACELWSDISRKRNFGGLRVKARKPSLRTFDPFPSKVRMGWQADPAGLLAPAGLTSD